MDDITSRDGYQAIADAYPALVRRARTSSAKAAIRFFCLTCLPGQRKAIQECVSRTCPLWPYRLGRGFDDPGLYVPEKAEATEEQIKHMARMRREGDGR